MYNNNHLRFLSWSKINLFLNCQRCFYKDQKLAMRYPGLESEHFKLNKAVDELLKNEFDGYRYQQKAHPVMIENGIDAVPFRHASLKIWQDSYRADGIRFYDSANNIIFFGGIDDLWMNSVGELIVVEYKATVTTRPVFLDNKNRWHREYMRQISFYAWLFRKNKYKVSPISYFIFCNGITDNVPFDKRLEFDYILLPYFFDDSWVEQTIKDICRCLDQEYIPLSGVECKFCAFSIPVSLSGLELGG
jgi:hypothetical protein